MSGYGNVNYVRAKDSPFEVMNLLVDLERDQPNAPRNFDGITHTPTVEDSALSVETQFNYFRQTNGSVLVGVTVQTENDDLVFADSGGIQTARLNIFGHIITVADKRIGKFEDFVTTSASTHELAEVKGKKSIYGKAFILRPGKYRLDLLVRDVNSGAVGVKHTAFEVPAFADDHLTASSLVLATKLENAGDPSSGSQFVIGPMKVVPSLSHVFNRTQPVGLYLQIYNAAIDQMTLRPAAEVEYVLLKDGAELWKQSEDWTKVNDSGQRLTLTRLIDTQKLAPGKYSLVIHIHDQVTDQRITRDAMFTIVP